MINYSFKAYTKFTVHFPFLIWKSQTRLPNKANGANNRGAEWRASVSHFHGGCTRRAVACAQHPSTSLSANHSLTWRVRQTAPLSTICLPVITVVCPRNGMNIVAPGLVMVMCIFLVPLSGPPSQVRLLERSCNLLRDGFSLNWMRWPRESIRFGSSLRLVVPVYL